MPFLDLDSVKLHLRIDGTDSDDDLEQKMAAAERIAIEYLQCNVYADQTALNAAVAAVPAALVAAKAAYTAASDAASAMDDVDLSLIEEAHAMSVYMRAVYGATRTRSGVVINDQITAAMLLIVGWLYEVREDVADMPRAAQDLLNAFRCYG